jgi:Outer membrane protein beta-barrel domain
MLVVPSNGKSPQKVDDLELGTSCGFRPWRSIYVLQKSAAKKIFFHLERRRFQGVHSMRIFALGDIEMKNMLIVASRLNLSVSLLCSVAFVVLPLGAARAAAVESRGYVGTRLGLSDDVLSSGENSVLGELFGGIRINEHWAVEASLFGTNKDRGRVPDVFQNTEGNHLRLRGATLSARYTWPLTELARVHLRGGVANLDTRYRYSVVQTELYPSKPVDPLVFRGEVDGNSFGGVLAIGIDTKFGDRWRIGAELQHYRGDLRLVQDSNDSFYRTKFNQSGSLQAAVLTLAAEF